MFCQHVWQCTTTCMPLLSALELELQTVVSLHAGAGNRAWILWTSTQLLAHLC